MSTTTEFLNWAGTLQETSQDGADGVDERVQGVVKAEMGISRGRVISRTDDTVYTHTLQLNDENVFQWDLALLVTNPDSLYYGGYFKAQMNFPKDYPYKPPGKCITCL